MAKILLVTDAWKPQVNGVVTTLTNLVDQARNHGDRIYVYHPGRCSLRFKLSLYPEIEVGIPNFVKVYKILKTQKWDHVHIATPEGPLGFTFSTTCRVIKIPYSCSCHTKFPEFVNSRFKWFPVSLGWKIMKYLYSGSEVVLTTTNSMVQELKRRGFSQKNYSWTRGVDRNIFYPDDTANSNILLCVSRVSHEKGLDDFCSLDIPGFCKVVVGDGPYLETLKARYPAVKFVGKQTGNQLANYYRSAAVFVFPSKNDTFGVVNIESIACGTPVAAYPVTGPIDIIESGLNGYLSDNLEHAVQKCLELDRTKVYNSSLKWSWEACYRRFKNILVEVK